VSGSIGPDVKNLDSKAGSALSDGDGESMAWLAEAVAALDATGHGSSLVPAEVRGAVARVAPNV